VPDRVRLCIGSDDPKQTRFPGTTTWRLQRSSPVPFFCIEVTGETTRRVTCRLQIQPTTLNVRHTTENFRPPNPASSTHPLAADLAPPIPAHSLHYPANHESLRLRIASDWGQLRSAFFGFLSIPLIILRPSFLRAPSNNEKRYRKEHAAQTN
jgi:hypothetical protein